MKLLVGLVGVVACALLAPGGFAADLPDADDAGADTQYAVVLAYHHISSTTPAATSVTPRRFEQHLDYIADNGFRVWSLERLVTALRAGEPVPRKVVALTFDDAYQSVQSEAWPRLRARGWPFTVFVHTEAADRGAAPYMGWSQIRELAAAGVGIGNHSVSHGHLVRGSAADARADITAAQQRFAAELGAEPRLFAWPYGEYTSALADVLDDLDLIGFGQHSGAVGAGADFGGLPRFPLATGLDDLDRLATALQTRPLPVSASPEGPAVLAPDDVRPTLEIRLGRGRFRADALNCFATGQGRMTLEWLDREAGRARIQPSQDLGAGRTKYNCTAPHVTEPGVYYWWSYLLMKPGADGGWYDG